MDNYEDLYEGYADDMIKYINLDVLNKTFNECVPLTELEAREVAKNMAKAYRELPDGIRTVVTYRKYSFEDLKNGSASKN
jgi:hypothetical protein